MTWAALLEYFQNYFILNKVYTYLIKINNMYMYNSLC